MPLLASLHFSHCLHRFTLDAIQINLITCSLTWQTNIRILTTCAQKKKTHLFLFDDKKRADFKRSFLCIFIAVWSHSGGQVSVDSVKLRQREDGKQH